MQKSSERYSVSLKETQIILGNSGRNFSGVTSTMLQVLHYQQQRAHVAVLGPNYLPAGTAVLSYRQFLQLTKAPLANGEWRVFHARRNDEMIQALAAKILFGAKIKIAFTSTAQRRHSRFTRWLISKMDSIISTSTIAAAFVQDRGVDKIIPHGIDVQRYSPGNSRREVWDTLGLPGSMGIGIFGRVRHSKGIDILVDAAIPILKQRPEVTVVICGECLEKDQAYQNQMQRKLGSAGLSDRVVFLGKQPFSALPSLFQAMTIVTALSRNEGFGLTPLEAMASGCAVITSEAGAWTDIIDNGYNGYCVPTGDVLAVTEKLEILLSDPAATETMGIVAREHIMSQYTVEKEAQSLTQFLLSLCR
jgi:mannosyltransferase